MLALRRPQRTLEQLKALAASGSSSYAREAQAELKRRKRDELAACLPPKGGEGR